MRRNFLTWRETWSSANVTAEAEEATANWLVGTGDDLDMKPNCSTVRVVNHVENRAPFGTLVKYRVTYDNKN